MLSEYPGCVFWTLLSTLVCLCPLLGWFYVPGLLCVFHLGPGGEWRGSRRRLQHPQCEVPSRTKPSGTDFHRYQIGLNVSGWRDACFPFPQGNVCWHCHHYAGDTNGLGAIPAWSSHFSHPDSLCAVGVREVRMPSMGKQLQNKILLTCKLISSTSWRSSYKLCVPRRSA